MLIETSGRRGAVGLARNGAVVQSAWLDATRRHARDLSECVRQLLAADALSPKEIAGVIVSLGPGGYTGLRVGLASAKALALAIGCPLTAVPTFHAIIESLDSNLMTIEVIADALKGQVFSQRFQRTGDVWKCSSGLRFQSALDWAAALTGVELVIGPGVANYRNMIPTDVSINEQLANPTLPGLRQAGQKQQPLSRDEMFAIEPLYLRGSSAEEKRNAQSEPPSAASASLRVS